MMQSGTTPDPNKKVAELLRAGTAAAQAGQRERARDLLTQVIELQEDTADAWLWLSGVVEGLEEKVICLENVLTLEPDNQAARRGLRIVRQKQVEEWLKEGVAAAEAGQRERAEELLRNVVQHDERNVAAWMSLYGVVDNREEQEICLDNVLTLDPDHTEAQHLLALLQGQRAQQAAPAVEAVTTLTASPEPTAPPHLALEQPPVTRPDADLVSRDELGDETLCPYCAGRTDTRDKKCPQCRGQLWIKSAQMEQGASRQRIALALQGACAGLNGLGLVLLLAYVAFRVEVNDLVALAQLYLGMSSGVASRAANAAFGLVPRPAVLLLAFFFLLSMIVLVGLYLRWKGSFFLALINGVGSTAAGMIVAVLLWNSFAFADATLTTLARLGMVMLDLGLAGVTLGLALELRHDAFVERRRIYLRLDRDAVGGMSLLTRGRNYARRGMWALAALHLRRAVKWLPKEVDAYLLLAASYSQLQRYQLAAEALAEARALRPDHPQVRELAALLDKHSRSASSQPSPRQRL